MNNIYFFIITFIGMYIGRKIGWILSRSVLYNPKLSQISTALICFLFGISVAFLIHLVIYWQHPNIVMSIIFGYILGVYVSIPNYGLLDKSTIPHTKQFHHHLIGTTSVISYIIAIILFETII